MKNQSEWKPSRILYHSDKDSFLPIKKNIYPGSFHVAEIQWKAYAPVFRQWCKGKLLDCGCGDVPYYDFLKRQTDLHYCIDWNSDPAIVNFLDEVVDLNGTFNLAVKDFDCVLLSDVIAHVKNPQLLIAVLSRHLRKDGTLVITSPFIYWMSAPPHEYFHASQYALKQLCEEAGLEVVLLESYGGYPDVLLDTLNKGMSSPWKNRLFRLFASVVKKSSWYKKSNEKTKYSYAIGYTIVARKK